MTKRIDPDGTQTTWTYGLAGPLTVTEPVTASPPTSRTSSIGYGPTGLATSMTDPRQKTTLLDYNSNGDLVRVRDPYLKETTFGYNGMGWRTSVKDHQLDQTVTDYDARGRVHKITNPAGKHVDFDSDAGWSKSTTDTLQRKTKYTHDPYGRLTVVEDATGGLTKYDYDLMSNLTKLTDAEQQATSFHYDSHGRVDTLTYPGGAHDTFTYDTVGRLWTKVDRKNVTTTFSYDDLDRPIGVSFSDGTPSVSYGYDALTGRLMTASNGTDTLTWTYDLGGQLRSEHSALNGSTVSYDYDPNGNRKELRLDGALYLTYGYDDASRLTSIVRGSNTFSFEYDDLSRRTSMTYPAVFGQRHSKEGRGPVFQGGEMLAGAKSRNCSATRACRRPSSTPGSTSRTCAGCSCGPTRGRGPGREEEGGRMSLKVKLMPIAVDAIYEDGVLKPKSPLDLPDKSEVHVTIETAEGAARTPLGRQLRELRTQILESGAPTLGWEEIEEEVVARRGGWREGR